MPGGNPKWSVARAVPDQLPTTVEAPARPCGPPATPSPTTARTSRASGCGRTRRSQAALLDHESAVGSMRYAVTNHYYQNRWQMMDLERVALVRADRALDGTASRPGDGWRTIRSRTPVRDAPCGARHLLRQVVPPRRIDPNLTARLLAVALQGARSEWSRTARHDPQTGTPPCRMVNGVFWTRVPAGAAHLDGWGRSRGAGGRWQSSRRSRSHQMDVPQNGQRSARGQLRAAPSQQVIALDAGHDLPRHDDRPLLPGPWINPYGNLHESNTANNISCTAARHRAAIPPRPRRQPPASVRRWTPRPPRVPGSSRPRRTSRRPSRGAGRPSVVTRSGRENHEVPAPHAFDRGHQPGQVGAARVARPDAAGLHSSCRVTSSTRSTCTVSWSRSGAASGAASSSGTRAPPRRGAGTTRST